MFPNDADIEMMNLAEDADRMASATRAPGLRAYDPETDAKLVASITASAYWSWGSATADTYEAVAENGIDPETASDAIFDGLQAERRRHEPGKRCHYCEG